MIKYCEQDVLLLEEIYLNLSGYMGKGHPNLTLDTDNITCPKCGSTRKHRYDTLRTASGVIRQQYKCQDLLWLLHAKI